MAIKEIKREWSPCQLDYVKTYLLHSEKDVADLPKCCVGSKATVSETDNEYFCTVDGWKLSTEIEPGMGGGGSAGGGNAGGSAGGGSSAPAHVVILPETTVELAEGQGILTTPLTTMPADGETLVVTYNGTDYDCPALVGDMGGEMCLVGTFAALGVPGGNPNAPFMILISSDPDAVASAGYAGMIMALDGATSVTLSIAKKTGGMSAAELPFVIVPFTVENSQVNIMKPFDSIMALANSGKMVYLCGNFVNALWYLPMITAGNVDGEEKIVFGHDGMTFTYTRVGVKVS